MIDTFKGENAWIGHTFIVQEVPGMRHMQRINTDNKGFSLVELIVVVLIMGILAVGLTPQVTKWINNARKASDIEYMHNLESAVSYALLNESVLDEVNTAVLGAHSDIVLQVNSDGTNTTIGGTNKLLKKTAEILGFTTDDEGIAKFKAHKISASECKIVIHINGGRAVGQYIRESDGSIVEITDD